MELDLWQIDVTVNRWDATRAFASVLHDNPGSDWFKSGQNDPIPRKLNFQVVLGEGPGGVRNNGRGTLTLPSRSIGQKLLRWLSEPGNEIRVGAKAIKMKPAKTSPKFDLKMTLQKAPYIDPDTEERLLEITSSLDRSLHIDEIQFGIFLEPKAQPGPRIFSVEYCDDYRRRRATLKFEWKPRLIRLTLGDDMMEQLGYHISIPFSSVVKIELGRDFGMPFICFELANPPIFEEFNFNRELQHDWADHDKFRRRVAALNECHAAIAPYAHHLRILLFNEHGRQDPLDSFIQLCRTAVEGGLRIPVNTRLEANKTDACFTTKRLSKVQKWLYGLNWDVAFQIELMLHNGLLNTKDVLGPLKERIDKIHQKDEVNAGFILRRFVQALRTRPHKQTYLECFDLVCREHTFHPTVHASDGMFYCHHLTVTPTRFLLEGPYVVQSNRIIREYKGFEHNFLRVDFRDEDRLSLRWDRSADGKSFLESRVGSILKRGFELAGRKFEFLAYSSSALRSHSVWFMTPFEHPGKRPKGGDIRVTSDFIRDTLGTFKDELIRQPSKYAARLAQAFTATDPSVSITRDQWDEVPDIGTGPSPHTDGCGTISPELGDKIWAALCANRSDHGPNTIKPSVYQIRFLGYKGVVSIDKQLTGIKMHLRRSMNKFESDRKEAEIEIARAFEKPNACYLNRPLIMVLEDRGVRREAFEELQDAAVAEARTIDDSINNFCKILSTHNLGHGFHLEFLMKQLERLGLDLKNKKGREAIDDHFLSRIRQIAMNHVLRDIKHGARIPVPNSWLLVGVADEGPAYESNGYKNVYCLPKDKIYACVQLPGQEPIWVKGTCLLYRSPVVHPGDVLVVSAIGQPPKDKLCLFGHLKNAVVLPSVDERSMASQTGGGDVDGDLFYIVKCGDLVPSEHIDPASYDPVEPRTLDRPSTVEDICDFIVEYIASDVLGLLSDRHLVIADQSKDGTKDWRCMELAKLCSKAVDYPKSGELVNIDEAPRTLIRFKPDWREAEVVNPHQADFYPSTRALGYLYRAIKIENNLTELSPQPHRRPLSDPISKRLYPKVQGIISDRSIPDGSDSDNLFQSYAEELDYICLTHAISTPNRLTEEEVVVGTILAKCSQKRWRSDRMHSMRTNVSALTRDIQNRLFPAGATADQARCSLVKAWAAWDFSLRHRDQFGANSFGIIALNVLFDCFAKLGVVFTD